ncbi:polyprenyl synthetase family protein [Bacillaceae bacterium S4-13-56]
MDVSIEQYVQKKQVLINQELHQILKNKEIPERLKTSMEYSLQAGGKRLRPILLLGAIDDFGGELEKGIPIALAIEMLHTYSLIHDDLPAMDDDDLRRGVPTNHRQFGEATAILTGDALLTYSFELISTNQQLSDHEKIYLIREFSKAAGPEGMVAGQMLDIMAEGIEISLDDLENIHQLKTGQLLCFSIIAGAYLSGVRGTVLQNVKNFATCLGLIFQVQDDILDVIGDQKLTGKAIGSDEERDKSTYPKLLGIDGAIRQKSLYVTKAVNILDELSIKGKKLEQLLYYVSEREA